MTNPIDNKIRTRIKNSQRILITSHVRPDADAVGSLLGLGLALENAGKDVQMVLEDGARKYKYMPGSEKITLKPQGDFELIIVLDCSDPARVGSTLSGYGNPDIVVDHHKTNLEFGAINVVEPEQVATAAILFDHLFSWGLGIDAKIATCLLAGIVGDTIGFRTSNVNAEVMRKTASLIDYGADLPQIYRNELIAKPYIAVRYWGAGLSLLEKQDGLVWATLTLADRNKIGYDGNDDADLINVLSSIEEAEIALIFVEQPENSVKISWRARQGIDVSLMATKYGGGGHAAAAGADVEGSLEEIKNQVILDTKLFLEKYR
jgi:phosphoesterase RecJ-like protein